MSSKRIIITTGGTGGHLLPAQALAQQLAEKSLNHDLLFVGGGLATNNFFDRSKFTFNEVSCGTLSKNPFKFCKQFLKILNGIRQSIKIIKKFKPHVVVGFGSYYTFPMLLAAKICKVPFILHEANSIPGKANKWLAPYATCIGIQFPQTASFLKGTIIEVALPIHSAYSQDIAKKNALGYFSLAQENFTLLIFGGSQGAIAINRLVEEALPFLNGLKIQFIHLVGKNEDEEKIRALYSKYLFTACIKSYEKNMSFAWKAADLFVGRAGAATIAEAIACEIPGILIPYPHAAKNHQEKNADFFTDSIQAGIKLAQEGLTGQILANMIKKMMLESLTVTMKTAIQTYKKRQTINLKDLTLKIAAEGKLS